VQYYEPIAFRFGARFPRARPQESRTYTPINSSEILTNKAFMKRFDYQII